MLSHASLRVRLQRRCALATLAVSLVTAALAAAHARRTAYDRECEQLSQTAHLLALQIGESWLLDGGAGSLSGLATHPQISFASIDDTAGNRIAVYPPAGETAEPDATGRQWQCDVVFAGQRVGTVTLHGEPLRLPCSRAWLDSTSWLAALGAIVSITWLAMPKRRQRRNAAQRPAAQTASSAMATSFAESTAASLLAAVSQAPPAATPAFDITSPAERVAAPVAAKALAPAPSSSRSATAPPSPSELPSIRVLAVDDAETNRTLMQLALGRAGALVFTAENGRAAIDKALAEPVDIIVLDMQMPVVDGYAAAAKLREIGFTGPIVALASNPLRDDEESCQRAGCNYYFAKPIDPERLVQTVRAALGGKKLARGEPTPMTPAEENSPDRIYSDLSGRSSALQHAIDGFTDSLPARMKQLRKSLADSAFSRLAEQAQSLQVAAEATGFKVLAWAAAPLALAARERDQRAATAALGRLAETAARVEAREEVDEVQRGA